MKREAFCFKIREDMIDLYKQRHESVWPELIEALQRHGWHNYSIFMREDGLCFGYFEAEASFEASVAGVEAEVVDQKWKSWNAGQTEPIRLELTHGVIEATVIRLDEVFHVD